MNEPIDSNFHVVLGAGPLGRAVAQALLAQGRRVRIVNRSGAMAEAPAGAEVRAGELYDSSSVRALTGGAAAVYQCAQPEYHEWPANFPPLMRAILDGLDGTGSRLVLGDNLYMYGPVVGPIHEGLPNAASTRKGKARALVADMALEAHRAGRVPVTIGRGSDFFGPWVLDSLMGERVFRPALEGRTAQLAGNLDIPHTVTSIRDFGRALAVLGEREEALGQVWHVPNERPNITQREFLTLVFECAGKPVRLSAMGPLMMRLGGLFIPAAREVVEMMYEFEEPHLVDSSKFERAFALRSSPLAVSIGETVDWFRAHPTRRA